MNTNMFHVVSASAAVALTAFAGDVCSDWVGNDLPKAFASGAAVPSLDVTGPRSAYVRGDFSRFERVWARLERGEPCRIGVIGGSITQGAGATGRERQWGSRFAEGWRRAFPKARIEFFNAGIGATGSDIGAFRLRRDVLAKKPDVVAVEFSVNDANDKARAESYEGLVRQLLNDPGDIAVILLGMVSQSGDNSQLWHGKVAAHYGIPYVSYRDGLYFPYVKEGTVKWTDISPDTIHPNDAGHAYAAALVNWTLARHHREWKASGRAAAAVPAIPAPLFGTTYDQGEFMLMKDAKIIANEGFFPLKDDCWGEGLACTNANGRLVFEVEGSTAALLYRCGCKPFNWGRIAVKIDGRSVVDALDCFRDQWWWYTPSLQLCRDRPGRHVVEVTTLAEKNGKSNGFGCHLTGFLISGGTPSGKNMQVTPSFGGSVSLSGRHCDFRPRIAARGWKSTGGPQGGITPDKDGVTRFSLSVGGTPPVECTFRGEGLGPDKVRLAWTMRPTAEVRLGSLGVFGGLPYADWKGGWVEADGKRVDFRSDRAQGMYEGVVKRLAIVGADSKRNLVFDFATPTCVYLQNDRAWGVESFGVRFLVPSGKGGTYRGGVTTAIDVTVTGAGAWNPSTLEPVTLQAGRDWIPFQAQPWIKPGTALDFSSIRRTEKPAGRYGRVIAKGENFEFEKLPGVPQRFYGINVCGDANTIELEPARRFAANLARLGYNAIRFHHHESTLVAGMDDPERCTLNPRALAGFDALVAACVEHGIYMTTDLFVSRHNAGMAWRTFGIDRDGKLDMNDYKFLVPVNERIFRNLLTFTRNFFGHRNPHTGRTFAEEPAVVGVSLVNEGNLDKCGGDTYASEPDWRNAYRAWLEEKKRTDPTQYADVPFDIPGNFKGNRRESAFLVFLMETEMKFAARVQAFLRDELGCKALTTNMNDGWGNTAAFQYAREKAYDYVDSHFYVDHPSFLGKPWRLPSQCPNSNPIVGEAMGAQQVGSVRSFNRPFTITEYNFSGPGRFRGVGGIACGTQAALQNWAGLWRFAWSHGAQGVLNPERKTMGYFDVAGDPLALAAERASICLFLRRDLEVLKRSYEMVIPEKSVRAPGDALGHSAKMAWAWAGWYAKVGTRIGDEAPAGSAGLLPAAFRKNTSEVLADLLPGATPEHMPVAGDGHLRVDGVAGAFLLDTPRTSGGFAEGGKIDCGALKADLGRTAATLWASSLDDAPIADSKRILVTYLTDVQNTGIRYADADLKVLLDFGRLPHLMRNGRADVELKTAGGAWKCWALNADGTRRAEVPVTQGTGAVKFRVDVAMDPAAASFLYELARD